LAFTTKRREAIIAHARSTEATMGRARFAAFGRGTIIDKDNGKPIELPYYFWIMRNIKAALQALAKQS
jgi:hypothetical protein